MSHAMIDAPDGGNVDAQRRALPRFSQRLSIGANGVAVSPFCVGIVGDWRVIPAAFEAGINFFFITTDMHWPLYEQNRIGFRDLFSRPGVRDQVVVTGACYPTQPEFCVAPFQELVEAVPGLGRVDILVAGGSYAQDLIPRVNVMRSVAPGLKARAVGGSFHDRRTAVVAANCGIVDLAYIRYNPAHPGARSDLFPHLVPTKKPIFNFKSMMGYQTPAQVAHLNLDPAVWYPHPTDYYRYALSRWCVDGLLCALGEVSQIPELDAAMQLGGLIPEEEDHLDQLAILTKQRLGVMA